MTTVRIPVLHCTQVLVRPFLDLSRYSAEEKDVKPGRTKGVGIDSAMCRELAHLRRTYNPPEMKRREDQTGSCQKVMVSPFLCSRRSGGLWLPEATVLAEDL